MLLAYPTTDRESLRRMPESGPVLMVDSTDHLDLIESSTSVPVRLCIEIDLSYPIAGGRIKIGAKPSPIRTPEGPAALAGEIEPRPRPPLPRRDVRHAGGAEALEAGRHRAGRRLPRVGPGRRAASSVAIPASRA